MTASNDNIGQPIPDDPQELLREVERLRAELARSEASLAAVERLACRDPLVDLLNRRSFITALHEHLSHHPRSDAAVLFVDVDGLKLINDKFGHQTGDRALIKIARILVDSVRKQDIVARLGGDEFAILLKGTDELNAWRMALRVAEAVGERSLRVRDRTVPLSVAVGAGVIEHNDTPERVLSRADQVMYRFKAIGGSPLAGIVESASRPAGDKR